MMKYIFVLLCMLSTSVLAETGDFFLEINQTSWHSEKGYMSSECSDYNIKGQCQHAYQKNKEYNSDNHGLGLSYTMLPYLDIKAGFYDNSFYVRSNYVGVNVHHDFHFKERVVIVPGLAVGLVTGYKPTQMSSVQIGSAMLMVLPNVDVGTKNLRVNFGLIPTKLVNHDKPNVITLQIRLKM